MSLVGRLMLTFAVLLGLFAVNLGVTTWSDQTRTRQVEQLELAVERHGLVLKLERQVASARQRIRALRVLRDSDTDVTAKEANDGLAALDELGTALERLVALLRNTSEDDPAIELLPRLWAQIDPVWRQANEHQLAVHSEPSEQNVEPAEEEALDRAHQDTSPELLERIRDLQTAEADRIHEASESIQQVRDTTRRATWWIFAATSLLAIAVAVIFSLSLARGVAQLEAGARRIGEGDLDHRIALKREDELGRLARSFDAMSSKLQVARQRVEEARHQAEAANQAKSTFLANMSHELRTPMNAIIGYSEMLVEDAEDLDQTEFIPDLQKIRSAGKHLLSLINDVLDLSKIEAGKMTLFVEPFEIEDLLGDVVSTVTPLAKKNGNRLSVETPNHLGSMEADQTKVRQTLLNLLSNACKFTSDGVVTLRARRDGETFRFEVEDTGIGMTSGQLETVFDEFTQADASTTRKFGGTGLGLAICRKFCLLMGGEVLASSAPGEGSTFTIVLPAVVDPAPEAPTLATPLPSEQGGGRP